MNDNKKTKAQLLDELADLRRQVRKQEKLRKSLEKSEEKYRATVNSIEEGYYEVDLTGKYTFINPAAGKFHGRSPDELIGTSYSDYTTPETADRIFQIFNQIYQTGQTTKIFNYQLINKEGKIRELEISVSLVRDAEGKPIGFRGIGWDATERKKMEAEKERYRDFVENITDGCWETDLTGKLTFANESACRAIGYTLEELMGMDYRVYTSPETSKILFTAFNEVYRTGLPADVLNYEVIHKDGKIIKMETAVSLIRDPAGNPIGFRGVDRNVTERKKMEAEQERYRDFFENIEDGCYEQDLEGKFTFINEAICRRLGYTREEILGMNFRDFITPETAERALKLFNEVYRTGSPTEIFDYEIFGKDKEVLFIQTTASLVRDPAGNPIGFRGVARDVTERKKMELEQVRYWDFIENMDDA